MTERFEGAPAGQPERGAESFAAETFTVPEPAVEVKREVPEGAALEERQAVEHYNAPIDRRAALVEEMMDQGTGQEKYGELWDDMTERLTQGRRAGETPLGRYLAEAENVKEVTALVKELRGGAAWDDVLAREVHELSEESVSERRLRALEAVSAVMNDAVREWKQPGGGVDRKEWKHLAGDMRAQALLRVSEIVNLEAKGARLRHGVLSAADREHSDAYASRLERLAASQDIPTVFRARARDTRHEWRMQQMQAGGVAVGRLEPASAEPVQESQRVATAAESLGDEPEAAPAAVPVEAAAEPSPAVVTEAEAAQPAPEVDVLRSARGDSEQPQPAAEKVTPRPSQPEAELRPELKSREAVFGREGISREDLKSVRRQVGERLAENSAEGAFAAARELAHLKRARVDLTAEGKRRVFDRLLEQRAAIGERDALQQARYLTYLKYLGAIDEVSAAERQRLELAIVERTARRRPADLDRLCVNAKYLGVRQDFSSMRPYLERDMARRLDKPDGEEGVAFARARRKFLELPHGLPDKHLQVEDRIDRRLMRYGQSGRWDRYVRLRTAVDYVRGGSAVEEPVQAAVAQHVAAERARARERGDWEAHTAYVADAALLSAQAEAARGEPQVRRAADSDVAQFLAGLELRSDLKSDEERTREWNAARERAGRPRKVREAAQRQPESAAEPEQAAPVDAAARPKQAAYEAAVAEHRRDVSGQEHDEEGTGGLLARWRRWWRKRFGGEEPKPDIDSKKGSEKTRRAA